MLAHGTCGTRNVAHWGDSHGSGKSVHGWSGLAPESVHTLDFATRERCLYALGRKLGSHRSRGSRLQGEFDDVIDRVARLQGLRLADRADGEATLYLALLEASSHVVAWEAALRKNVSALLFGGSAWLWDQRPNWGEFAGLNHWYETGVEVTSIGDVLVSTEVLVMPGDELSMVLVLLTVLPSPRRVQPCLLREVCKIMWSDGSINWRELKTVRPRDK